MTLPLWSVQPAGIIRQCFQEHGAQIIFIAGLMVFEHHPAVPFAEYLNFSGGMGHTVADTFAKTVLHGFCFLYDSCPFFQGHLELVFYPGHRAALENIIGSDSPGG